MRRTDDLKCPSKPSQISHMHSHSRGTWIEAQEAIDDDQEMLQPEAHGAVTDCQLRNASNTHEEPLPKEGNSVSRARLLDIAQAHLHLEYPVLRARPATLPRFADALADINSCAAVFVDETGGVMHGNGEVQGHSSMPSRRTPTIAFRPPFLYLADIPAPGGPFWIQQ